MNFVEAIQTCFRKYVVFAGRARRSEYWWFWLFGSVVGIALFAINDVLYWIFVLAVIVPYLAVSVRRLHDTGKSGWFLLIGLIPIVGPIILIVWFASAGKPEANQYGEAPA